MASLMEELLVTLESEQEIYEKLVPISEEKTKVLVKGDLEQLQRITEEEQLLLDRVAMIDRKRSKVIENMAVVLNKDSKELDLPTLARLMAKQPEEKRKISMLHDSLRQVMRRLVSINEKNRDLIENSLEMIEFNMNYIKSTRMSPGNNNYNRNAATGYTENVRSGGFDAKQ